MNVGLGPAFRLPGAPPLPSIRGNELLFVLPIQLNDQPGSTLASITIDQLTAFGGGGGSIPNNSVLGNISGVPAGATPLTPTELTNLINVFGPTTPGAVPAPGAVPLNAVLRADGTWQVLSPAGPSGALQFNDNGAWGGSSDFLFSQDFAAVPPVNEIRIGLSSSPTLRVFGTVGFYSTFFLIPPAGGGNLFFSTQPAGANFQYYQAPSGQRFGWQYSLNNLQLLAPGTGPAGSVELLCEAVVAPGSAATFRFPARPVADLQTPSAAIRGARATVTDALNQTGNVQGGGTNTIPVVCDGLNWISDYGIPAGDVHGAIQFANILTPGFGFTEASPLLTWVGNELRISGGFRERSPNTMTGIQFSSTDAGSHTQQYFSPAMIFQWGYSPTRLELTSRNSALVTNPGPFRMDRESGVGGWVPRPVATLPTPTSDLRGYVATVNDALGSGVSGSGAPTGIVQGGGANIVPVFCDGSFWQTMVSGDVMLLTGANTMTANAAVGWGPGRPTLNYGGLVIPGAVGSFVNGPTIFYNTIEFINGGISSCTVNFATTTINFTGLPTTNPNIAGRAWNNNGVLNISAG